MRVRILLAGGGTGGHLFPALAVAQVLREKGAEILFVGTKTGIEAKLLPRKKYPLKTIWLSGFNRRKIAANLLLPLKIVFSFSQSMITLSRFKPHAALGTGGYVCGPIMLAAVIKGIPIFLQEQNSFPGVTTRMLARFAREIFLNFKEAIAYLPKNCHWSHVGNPVRVDIAEVSPQEAQEKWQLNPDLPTVLVFGGSQGAMKINRSVHEILSELSRTCNLIWSRGTGDKTEITDWTGPGKLIVESFIDDMPIAYAAADLAVCRSGAMTLSELQASKTPAILVPYPFAAGDHQRHNATAYMRRGGAVMIEDSQLNGGKLLSVIKELLTNRERLAQMRQSLAEQKQLDASEIIADKLLSAGKSNL